MAAVRRNWISRLVLSLGLALVTAAVVAAPAAAAAGKVRSTQYFTGVINGTDGNTATPIVIKMTCAGPVSSGQTGHPAKGQTLAVHQLFPPSTGAGATLGYTGSDSEVGFFTAAPPSTGAAPAVGTTFTRYDKKRPLPTSLTLPCSGTGTVYFSPLPVVPPSRAATVPVTFVAQPSPVGRAPG
ncbi:MAG: hypothetical protein ACRDY1_11005 [Acidimicrobiales bacterium]